MARYGEGERVRMIGYQFVTGIPAGCCGTVTRSEFGTVYSDPAKRLLNVLWDDSTIGRMGCYLKDIEPVLGRKGV